MNFKNKLRITLLAQIIGNAVTIILWTLFFINLGSSKIGFYIYTLVIVYVGLITSSSFQLIWYLEKNHKHNKELSIIMIINALPVPFIGIINVSYFSYILVSIKNKFQFLPNNEAIK